MLTVVTAHTGLPLEPHDLWGAWNADVAIVGALVLAAATYARGRLRGGRRPLDAWRARAFAAALAVIAIALLSPLDRLSGALASAHMVQHVLLILVAAPLLALSAPASAMLRGSPPAVRRNLGRWRRRLRVTSAATRALRHPVTAWVLHVVALWVWHAAVLYDAALQHAAVHALEHATFLGTGLLFWRVVVGGRSAVRVPQGLGVLLVFGMGMQSVLLSLLLTFARASWYRGYASTTAAWGLEPLADQQLAGVIMWVPAGAVHVAVSLALLAAWIRSTEGPAPAGATAEPEAATSRR